jgi:hypothetical protein
MKSTETFPSAHVLKKAQLEEFDRRRLGSDTCGVDLRRLGQARSDHRPQVYRRLVSEHRLAAKQEHHSQIH